MPESAERAVFLSYAREDTAAAQRIAEALRSHGVEVWFDQNELRGGDAWDTKIRRQIKECALFMPVISARTQERHEGYFRLEWKLAIDRTHLMLEGMPFLAPVVVDDTPDHDAAVPAEFLRVQWTRLPGALPTPPFVEQVRRLLEAPRRPATGKRAEAAPVAGPTPAPKTRSHVRLAAGIGVAAALGLAAYLALRPRAERTPAAGGAAGAKSIAVLPFTNTGADKADDYLSDGMTEELISVLGKVKGLRVPGRDSSFAFKGKTEEGIYRKVGGELHVATVLEGSVLRAGQKLRITVELIDVDDGFDLWTETYERDMNDILAVQSEVAQSVVQALEPQLGVENARVLEKKPTENPEAYRLYLLGRQQWDHSTEAGTTRAARYFEQAIQLDPSFALAYCGLSDTYNYFGGYTMPGREAWLKEQELARKALGFDPDLADAHLSLGMGFVNACDFRDGSVSLKRALELNPNAALAHDQDAWPALALGRFEEAIAEERKAVELDPLSPWMNADLAYMLFMSRHYDEALVQARRTLEVDPGSAWAHQTIGAVALSKGDAKGALAEFQTALSLDPMPPGEAFLGYAYAVSGDRAGALKILDDLAELAKKHYVSPAISAKIYVALGDKENAFAWLEKCYEVQDPVCYILKVDPMYDPVRGDPRFRSLLKKCNLEN